MSPESTEAENELKKKGTDSSVGESSSEKPKISRRNFLKLTVVASAGISVDAALNNLIQSSNYGRPDLTEKELPVCPRPPIGCTISEQGGFMVRGGSQENQRVPIGETTCSAGPHKYNPDEYLIDIWTSGEEEGGQQRQANCLLLCNNQPPLGELKRLCDHFPLPQGVAIHDFKELDKEEGLNYEIGDADLSRLLAENNIRPEEINLYFFFARELIPVASKGEFLYAMGTMMAKTNGSRWITISELETEPDKRFHNHRIFKSLSGVERLNWIALHEIGEAILNLRDIESGGAQELWCDKFANENYSRFSIVQKRNP